MMPAWENLVKIWEMLVKKSWLNVSPLVSTTFSGRWSSRIYLKGPQPKKSPLHSKTPPSNQRHPMNLVAQKTHPVRTLTALAKLQNQAWTRMLSCTIRWWTFLFQNWRQETSLRPSLGRKTFRSTNRKFRLKMTNLWNRAKLSNTTS